MAVRKKKAETEFDIRAFNKGTPKRALKVGDRVDIYKVPFKEKFKLGSGRVKKIIWEGDLCAYVDVLRDGHASTQAHWIYLGKVQRSY
jgi:hypothetical protein